MTHDREGAPLFVDEFCVVDLDRTLLNTPVLVDMLLLQLHDHGFTSDDVRRHMEYIHAQAGKSLSLRQYFESDTFENGADLYDTLQQDLLELAGSIELEGELMYIGASDFLDVMDEKNIPFAILTYGDTVDQEFKLQLVGILTGRETDRLPAVITNEPNKAAWIEENWSSDEGLVVPSEVYGRRSIIADKAVIADDKIHNLVATNPNVRGILIDNSVTNDQALRIDQVAYRIANGETLSDMAKVYGDITSG